MRSQRARYRHIKRLFRVVSREKLHGAEQSTHLSDAQLLGCVKCGGALIAPAVVLALAWASRDPALA